MAAVARGSQRGPREPEPPSRSSHRRVIRKRPASERVSPGSPQLLHDGLRGRNWEPSRLRGDTWGDTWGRVARMLDTVRMFASRGREREQYPEKTNEGEVMPDSRTAGQPDSLAAWTGVRTGAPTRLLDCHLVATSSTAPRLVGEFGKISWRSAKSRGVRPASSRAVPPPVPQPDRPPDRQGPQSPLGIVSTPAPQTVTERSSTRLRHQLSAQIDSCHPSTDANTDPGRWQTLVCK